MGTETSTRSQARYRINKLKVKLNNPLMGTEIRGNHAMYICDRYP